MVDKSTAPGDELVRSGDVTYPLHVFGYIDPGEILVEAAPRQPRTETTFSTTVSSADRKATRLTQRLENRRSTCHRPDTACTARSQVVKPVVAAAIWSR